MQHYRTLLIAAIIASPAISLAQPAGPLFSFGAVADVQYADKPQAGARAYRDSLDKLDRCSALLARERLAFTIQLGDLTDAGADDLARIAAAWRRVPSPRYSVLGNHDLVAPREIVLKLLEMPSAYYDFTAHGFRFIVLNGMEFTDPAALARLKASGARNAYDWNGGLGEDQRGWLRRTLADAAAKKQRAVVFCHLPTFADACRPEHLLWDHAETLALIDSSPAAVAYISGHDHKGGYAARNGVHHVTLSGMVEHDMSSTCNVVDVFAGRMVIRAPAGGERRELTFRR